MKALASLDPPRGQPRLLLMFVARGFGSMNVFDLDQALVNDYERFARSFTLIRAPDIQQQVKELYASDRFWPEPLVSINPRFESGDAIDRLVANGTLHSATGSVFRSKPLSLYRHQAQAVAKAATRQSFVVTTGTGSGKSLCFFIPIIDAAVRARAAGEARRTRAVVIYPMNALANSQREEIDKFIKQSGLPDYLRPTFARYTGQESAEERERIREAKPDILLTNFMMLELLMTRQNGLDRAVIANAHGLDYLVLDELHTYRGRQGADVAMLVRRVRDRLCPATAPVCIGTSATMATDVTISHFAGQLGAVDEAIAQTIDNDSVLRHKRDLLLSISGVGETLAGVVLAELPGPDVLRSSAEVVAYAGLNPRQHQSGTSIDRVTRISKIGNAVLRAALYMPAMSAMRYNPAVAALVTRLKSRGRLNRKQIVIAAMRKLLVLCFGVRANLSTRP
jgi:hypothetical protein